MVYARLTWFYMILHSFSMALRGFHVFAWVHRVLHAFSMVLYCLQGFIMVLHVIDAVLHGSAWF